MIKLINLGSTVTLLLITTVNAQPYPEPYRFYYPYPPQMRFDQRFWLTPPRDGYFPPRTWNISPPPPPEAYFRRIPPNLEQGYLMPPPAPDYYNSRWGNFNPYTGTYNMIPWAPPQWEQSPPYGMYPPPGAEEYFAPYNNTWRNFSPRQSQPLNICR